MTSQELILLYVLSLKVREHSYTRLQLEVSYNKCSYSEITLELLKCKNMNIHNKQMSLYTHGALYIDTYNFLKNMSGVYNSFSHLTTHLTLNKIRIGSWGNKIQVLALNKVLIFNKRWGNYVYSKQFPNILVLKLEDGDRIQFAGQFKSCSFQSTEYLRVTPSNGSWLIEYQDDYGSQNFICSVRYACETYIFTQLGNIVNIFCSLPYLTKAKFVNILLLGGEVSIYDPLGFDIMRECGIPLFDVTKRNPTMLLRSRILQTEVARIGLKFKLSYEVSNIIHKETLLAECTEKVFTQLFSYNMLVRTPFLDEEKIMPLVEYRAISDRELLSICGDVEMNPGPITWIFLKLLFAFLFLYIFFYLNLSVFNLFISFLSTLYIGSWLYQFIYYVLMLWRERWKPFLINYFTPSYQCPHRWQDTLKPSLKPYQFVLLFIWLVLWAFLPLSAVITQMLKILRIPVPTILVEILLPLIIIFAGGVDVTDEKLYLQGRPDKYNYIVDVLFPYTIAYLYFFSLEMTWTTIPYMYDLYVAAMLALMWDLIWFGLIIKNPKTVYVSWITSIFILFLPCSRRNFYLLVWAFFMSIGSKYFVIPRLANKHLVHSKRRWTEEIKSRCLRVNVDLSLKLLLFLSKYVIPVAIPLMLVKLCLMVSRLLLLLIPFIYTATLILVIVIHLLPEVDTLELTFTTVEPIKIPSYHWQDRGGKCKGGVNRTAMPHEEVEALPIELEGLIYNFEQVSMLESLPQCYYTPNFSKFLEMADKIEDTGSLLDEVNRLKKLMQEQEKFKETEKRVSYFTKGSGKVWQYTYKVVRFLKSKRMRVKPVWLTTIQSKRLPLPKPYYIKDRLAHLLPRSKYSMTSLGNSINKAKEVWNISNTKDRFLRPSGKPCKQEPLLEELAQEWKCQGANSFKYNSERYIKSSIARYFEKPTRLSGSNAYAIKEAARALVEHNPKLYGEAKLWSPEHILKKTVLKYSCQFPLTNNPNWKSKRDVIRNLGKPEVLRTIADYIRSGHYFRSLHTVFLKLAVVNRPKIELNPSKQRTITAQDWLNYSLGMFVCGSVNKNFDFDSNSAPFTPILTGGLVRLATRLLKHKYFACMDFTAADSYFSSLLDGVIEVRKLGYRNNVDFDYIANVIEAYYDGLEKSVIINREQGRKYWKLRGLSTGHANTTPDNTIAEQIAMLMAWAHLTKRPYHEYYIYNDQPAYGDDNILGSSYYDLKTWNATNIAKYITEELGIPCRIEWEGNSLHGATFLAKQFCLDERVLKELLELGIKTDVAIIQDEAKIRQNFTVNLKNPNPTYIWNYCIGYLLQTSSLPHVYKDFHDYLWKYLKTNQVSQEQIEKLQKLQKIPTYEEVVRMTYGNRKARKMPFIDHTPILPSKIVDAYKKGFGRLAGELQIFENLTRTLGKFIPDVPEDNTKPLMFRKEALELKGEDFLLEAFIYYKADGPDSNLFKELCATSPYSNLLNPQIFMENLDVILPQISLAEALTIPNIMTLVMYVLNTTSKYWLNPIGWFQYINKTLSKLYLELNYFWWTQTGRSSFTLSKLVPKDPAYHEKKLCYWIAKKVRKILPNFYFNVKPYALDHAMSQYVITTPDAPRKINEHWDVQVPQVIEMLKTYRHITLKARTASGKTFFLPQLLKDYFPYITILTVNNVLVANNSTPGFSKVTHKCKVQIDSKYRVMTYGLWQAMNMKPREGEILLLDEFAERDEALYYAVSNNSQFSIAMSATPKVEGLPERPFIEVIVPRVHKIYTHEVNDYEEAISKCIELGLGRFLIIIPNVEKCISFSKQLNKSNLPATPVYSGSGPIPDIGHLVATTIVDSGVDIGDLDAVIDTGKSMKLVNGQLRLVDSNVSVIEQRQGRVGRRKDGHYFRLKSSQPTNDFTKECSFFTALFQPTVASACGVESPCLVDINEPLPPLFLDDDEEVQNTLNLAYYSLKTHSKFADAMKFYYNTLASNDVKGNQYIVGRYQFVNMLFDKALEQLDKRPHRFGMNGENAVLYNGKRFSFAKVVYSRHSDLSQNIVYISKTEPGRIVGQDELELLDDTFQARFTLMSDVQLSQMRSLDLCDEHQKQQIRKLFSL